MKGQWRGFAVGAVVTLLVCVLCGTAFAQTGKVMQELEYRNIKVTLDGKTLDLRNAIGDPVEPFMFGGTNYLPVRALAEALGLNVSWDGATATVVLTTPKPEQKDTYRVGDTWEVPGQWALTVTGVTETKERNPFADTNPAAVYVVDYEYRNDGWTDPLGIVNGIGFWLENETIVDSHGVMGSSYPGNKTLYPQLTPIGATCKAQCVIGAEHAGPFTIGVSLHGNDSKNHTAKFLVEP
ncbi:MAG: hypothetical protein J6X53_10355 [Abditibacteriota bacterium]|nr:hypothetical protein [Abditibacteriota bacterium]